MKQQEIKIKTQLDEGIYKSDGGGQARTHYSWNIGPRNLMSAIEMLSEHSESMTRGYGNVGHCGSWLEIAGIEMSTTDIADYNYDTDVENFDSDTISHSSYISKTKWCQRFISSVLDGSLLSDRADFNNQMAHNNEKEAAGFAAGCDGLPIPEKYKGDYFFETGHCHGNEIRTGGDPG